MTQRAAIAKKMVIAEAWRFRRAEMTCGLQQNAGSIF